MALLNPGSEKRVNMNGDHVYLGIYERLFALGEDNIWARFGLIRDHQLAMPGLFNVMK